jgi:predicted HD phosphohydrolase
MIFNIDRRDFIASLGGAAAVAAMSQEAKADALEDALNHRLNTANAPAAPGGGAGKSFPSKAELEAQIPTRRFRRGVGVLFSGTQGGQPERVAALQPMPAKPTFQDFLKLRFQWSMEHCLQSANHARSTGADEEIVFACFIHDHPQALFRANHGHWGGQLYEPYVSPRVAFAVRHHAALRFFDDEKAGYSYPDLYRQLFGHDYVPPPEVQAEYEMVRKHRFYEAARAVTVHDLYAFDPNVKIAADAFDPLVEKHFRNPKEGLGYDGSSAAHLWRTIANPDTPL